MRDGVIVARVCAPPVDGEANHALCQLIARRAGLQSSRVRVVSGAHARRKLLRVDDIERGELIDALGLSEKLSSARRGGVSAAHGALECVAGQPVAVQALGQREARYCGLRAGRNAAVPGIGENVAGARA